MLLDVNVRSTLKRISDAELAGMFGNGDVLMVVLSFVGDRPTAVFVRARETNEMELWKFHRDQSVTFHGTIALPFVASPAAIPLVPKAHGEWENIAWHAYDKIR